MIVVVNGAPHEVPEEASLAQLLVLLELADRQGLAAEIAGEFIEREDYEKRRLEEGDRIELVRLVGGG